VGKVFLFGNCSLVNLQFLQEGPLLTDAVEIKEKLGASVAIP
jgi:hypothetical protein